MTKKKKTEIKKTKSGEGARFWLKVLVQSEQRRWKEGESDKRRRGNGRWREGGR